MKRFGYVIAALLLASSAFHLVVYLIDGGGWDGPVSWRKPILFGFSFGLTLGSLVWVSSKVRLTRRQDRWIIGVLSVASLVEVAGITVQKWRGVPSHLNFATTTDGVIAATLAVTAIAGLIPAIIAITVLAYRRLDAPAEMRLAVRAGLAVLLLSQLAGAALIANGRSIGLPPEATDLSIFGAAGQLKVPHAVTLHALQALPILAAILAWTSWQGRARVRIVAIATAGYGGLILVAVLQALQGLAPTDLTVASGAVLLTSGAALAGAGLAALARVTRK